MPLATSKKRYIHRWLNYKGDQSQNADLQPGQIKGPNAMGEMYTVLQVTYNPETDMTRVGLDWARQSDYEQGWDPETEVEDAS